MDNIRIENLCICVNGHKFRMSENFEFIAQQIRAVDFKHRPMPRDKKVEALTNIPSMAAPFILCLLQNIVNRRDIIIPSLEDISKVYVTGGKEPVTGFIYQSPFEKFVNGFVMLNGRYYDARFVTDRGIRQYTEVLRNFYFALQLDNHLRRSGMGGWADLDLTSALKNHGGIEVHMGRLCYPIGIFTYSPENMKKIEEIKRISEARDAVDSYYAFHMPSQGSQLLVYPEKRLEDVLHKLRCQGYPKGQVFELC